MAETEKKSLDDKLKELTVAVGEKIKELEKRVESLEKKHEGE